MLYDPKIAVKGDFSFEFKENRYSEIPFSPEEIAVKGDFRIIQHLYNDNDSKHKSKLAQEYLKKHKIVALEWPPYSPDLNPIENIWGIMVAKLRKKNISTQSELIELVNQEWEKIDQEQIDN